MAGKGNLEVKLSVHVSKLNELTKKVQSFGKEFKELYTSQCPPDIAHFRNATKQYAETYVQEVLPGATQLVADVKEALHYYLECEQDMAALQVMSLLDKVETNLVDLSEFNKKHKKFSKSVKKQTLDISTTAQEKKDSNEKTTRNYKRAACLGAAAFGAGLFFFPAAAVSIIGAAAFGTGVASFTWNECNEASRKEIQLLENVVSSANTFSEIIDGIGGFLKIVGEDLSTIQKLAIRETRNDRNNTELSRNSEINVHCRIVKKYASTIIEICQILQHIIPEFVTDVKSLPHLPNQ